MIEEIDDTNIDEVLPLIRQYMEFYEVKDIDDAKNRAFFSQFGINSDKGCLFAYRDKGVMVAFATVYFSYASSILAKVAVMNDLFTLESSRGQGFATALIRYCKQYAMERGASRLQWVTADSNKTAQSVYQSLGAKHSSWEFYTY